MRRRPRHTATGRGSYVPVIWLSYWSFRLMMGFGFLILFVAAGAIYLSWRRRLERSRWFLWAAVVGISFPFAANTSGWLFTETGRQPWIVWGLMKTSAASSPSVGVPAVIGTLVGFGLLYTVLGVVDVVLMARAAGEDLGPPQDGAGAAGPVGESGSDVPASLVY